MTWDHIQLGISKSYNQLRMQSEKLADDMALINDTYNASPASTIAALGFLKSLPGRRVAILGDMLELGQYEQSGHQSVGDFLPEAVDFVILVGERSQMIAQSARAKGFTEKNLIWFPDSDQAAQPAVNVLEPGDVILIKGSNSMRMHTILDAIRARYTWQTPQ
jgi:UDP-N-acetylmuramoyl-tripeptide--D-alanyl-D-alanine ligase